MTAPSVNSWVRQLETEDTKGLYILSGQNRKPIMDYSDEEAVDKAIESDSVYVWLRKPDRTFSVKDVNNLTFKRFLYALALDIDV